ncbi:hypothetical protein LZ518_05455 [Sphingomonas sp. RB56-2]|uniref:DUF1311 domain-containing protein n=1 Tax=Sphingomonas brevis TaxID=2908206 RepID=A0ABT0S8B6_9SPHN|nr:lysozyme inhibitor LprI family protein [Sphingomonas brevis]MCL6740577.1 hypothetical protein [Sphingomonas brevis]
MEDLTANQVALISTAALLFGGFLGWLGRGAGFVLKRLLTGSPKQERATYLNTVADLGAKLRAHGMTIQEVRKLEDAVQNPSLESSSTANQVVEQLSAEADDSEPEAFQSNMAMKMRTSAAYEVAEAKLNQALMDLRLLVGEHEWECVEAAQGHWQAYRGALEDWALREWDGGTGATLAMQLVGMAETERRADEIAAQVKERASR